MASKLAVELWLRKGDLEQARASLERYTPLGAADPDLVRFKTRLRELEAKGAGEPPPATATAAAATAPAPAPAAAPAEARPATTSW